MKKTGKHFWRIPWLWIKHTGQSRTGRTIKVEEEDELILAKMDARLIVQVLINLIGNAVKYTPQGTDITVRVKKEKAENAERSQVIISVCDLGNGIPDDRKERVFDMFYTGSDQVADSRRSLGLGLGLCRSIINAHRGKIWISDNIPHGAVQRWQGSKHHVIGIHQEAQSSFRQFCTRWAAESPR